MSNKKTRKGKILSQEREQYRQLQINELKNLKSELESKIAKQKKENFRQFNVRNLKIFLNTCNFVAPFLLSASITVGVFKLFGGGLPFCSDEIIKYKLYSIDSQSKGYVTMEEEYRTNRWFDASLPSNTLIIYTPWEFQKNQYVRFKREYSIKNIKTLELFNAVLEEDYEYISNNLTDYKEEKQVKSEIDLEEPNDYSFEASLYMFDKEDVLKYKETDLKNIVITLIELALGLGVGGAIAYFRRFKYLYELERVNNHYKCNIKAIKPMQQQLQETNEKILSLIQRKGGRV